MSFQRVKETGNGLLDYRLEIAGIPYNFVSNNRLVLSALSGAGYTRLPGLIMEGQTINYRIDALMGELQADSLSFQVVDADENVTRYFIQQPTWEARLIEDAEYNDGSIAVSHVGSITTGSLIHIGQEALRVAGVNQSSGIPLLTCARGVLGSDALSYRVVGESGDAAGYVVTDRPVLLEGRKVKLFAYGEGDNPEGPGQVIWRGVIDSDLTLTDGGTFEFSCQPITSKLEQEIGGNLGDEFKIRGVYHPSGYGLGITLYEHSAGFFASPTISASVYVEGFHATKEDLVTEFNVQLAHSMSIASPAFTQNAYLGFAPDGSLSIFYRTAATARWMSAYTWSGIQKVTNVGGGARPIIEPCEEEFFHPFNPNAYQLNYAGVEVAVRDVSANQDYFIKPNVPTPYPTRFAAYAYGPAPLFPLPTSNAPYPPGRLYLDVPVMPSLVTKVIGEKQEEGWIDNIVLSLSGTNPINSSLRYVDTSANGYFQIKDEDTLFTLACEFVPTGSVVDFLTKIALSSTFYSAQGMFPKLTTDDLDLDDMNRTMSGVYQSAFAMQRSFSFWGESRKLNEIVAEECKLLGVFPSITQEGKITLKALRDITATEIGAYQINSTNALTKPNLPQWVRSGDTIVNEATLKTGYNAGEDEWMGPTYNAVYVDSVANLGRKKKLKLEPYSGDTVYPELSEINNILWKIIGRWGVLRPELRSVDVPFTAFTATLGGATFVTLPQMPNPSTGARGLDSQPGIIKAISFDLSRGRGSMTISLADTNIAGYSPSLLCTSLNANSAPEYKLNVTSSLYSPGAINDLSWFNVGDNVKVFEYGTWNPTLNLTGTVTAKSSTITIAFPRNLTATELNALTSSIVSYAPYSGSVTTYQKLFCFISQGYLSGGATGGSSAVPTRYFGV